MKTHRVFAAAAVTAALVAFTAAPLAGEKCTADTQTCLNKMTSHLKDRGWAGLEMERGEKGLSVTRVVAGSPAEEAGFRQGDRIVAINGLEVSEANEEKLYAARKTMLPGTAVAYTVKRGYDSKDLKVTLASVPRDVLAGWVGGHMLDHSSATVAVN